MSWPAITNENSIDGGDFHIADHKEEKFFSSVIPLGRWGEADELAKAVLFLASDDSSYINAVELMVDGGATGAPLGAPLFRH